MPTRVVLSEGIESAVGMIESGSAWQAVIHGGAMEFRRAVVETLGMGWSDKRLMRYALCGCADRLESRSDGYKLRPCGCGESLCPRCSRRAGCKQLRQIENRFRRDGHRTLVHAVLTQRVIVGESLEVCAARMDAKWDWLRRGCKRVGVLGGLAVVHCKFSRVGGWHYHIHVVLEVEDVRCLEALSEKWSKRFEDVREGGFFRKVIASPQSPETIDFGTGDLYERAGDCVGAAIGYVVSDVLRGAFEFGASSCPAGALPECVRFLHGFKRTRRILGWVKVVQDVEDVEETGVEGKAKASASEETPTVWWYVDDCIEHAIVGVALCVAAVEWLTGGLGSGTGLGVRLRALRRRVFNTS